jgi:hypothetical protein
MLLFLLIHRWFFKNSITICSVLKMQVRKSTVRGKKCVKGWLNGKSAAILYTILSVLFATRMLCGAL